MEPEIYQYRMEPLSNDLPILKEFMVLENENGSNDFEIRQEEPPKGWDMGRNFEQIMPSYHFLWNENDPALHYIFIPSSLWRELCEKYDEIYLITYREYANGKNDYMKLEMNPDNLGYSTVALYGDFFSFSLGTSTDYITFFGIRK